MLTPPPPHKKPHPDQPLPRKFSCSQVPRYAMRMKGQSKKSTLMLQSTPSPPHPPQKNRHEKGVTKLNIIICGTVDL